MLTEQQTGEWNENGFFIIRNFADGGVCAAMLARAVEISRLVAGRAYVPNVLVTPEKRPNELAKNPEDQVAKIFRLHRDSVFRDFGARRDMIAIVVDLLGADLDLFVSQFIFKNHGALGQPWHQDSYYFAFDRTPQVGMWLAVSDATLDNGCLHALPGSHREPVQKHVRDQRTHALYGYEEIVDYDTSRSVPVLMAAGDLLVFHSHLMHRSTDNLSTGFRAAMVYHYAQAGTVDRTRERFGHQNPVHDFMPICRGGELIAAA
jgi:phytanoyl-CoA hydroxylase